MSTARLWQRPRGPPFEHETNLAVLRIGAQHRDPQRAIVEHIDRVFGPEHQRVPDCRLGRADQGRLSFVTAMSHDPARGIGTGIRQAAVPAGGTAFAVLDELFAVSNRDRRLVPAEAGRADQRRQLHRDAAGHEDARRPCQVKDHALLPRVEPTGRQ